MSMNSYLFYPREKSLKIPFTAFINWKYLIPFKKSVIWIFYSNGCWMTYDFDNNKLVCKGEATKGPEKLCDYVKCPRILDDEHVIAVNSTTFRLECLNVYTGKIKESWKGETPSEKSLTQEDRKSNEGKVIDCLNSLKMEYLRESKLVAVLDNYDTNQGGVEYVLNFFKEGESKTQCEVLFTGSKSDVLFAKVNESDSVMVWEQHLTDSFEFWVFNLNKPTDGFKKYSSQQKINATLMSGFPWGPKTVSLCGNPDDSGVPRHYTYNLEKNKLEIREMAFYYPRTTKTNLTEIIPIDYDRKNFLTIELYEPSKVTVYNTESQRAVFFMEQQRPQFTELRGFYALSCDNSYVVEYQAHIAGDEEPDVPSETKIAIMRLIERKVYILHMLRCLRTRKSDVPFFDYYGDQYVAQSIAEMICGTD